MRFEVIASMLVWCLFTTCGQTVDAGADFAATAVAPDTAKAPAGEPRVYPITRTIPLNKLVALQEHGPQLQISGDGSVACVTGHLLKKQKKAKNDTLSIFIDLKTGKQIGKDLEFEEPNFLSADGKTATFTIPAKEQQNYEEDIVLYSIADGTQKRIMQVEGVGTPCYAFSPDGKTIIALKGKNKIVACKVPSGEPAFEPVTSESEINRFSRISMSGKFLTLSADGKVSVRSVKDGRAESSFDSRLEARDRHTQLHMSGDGTALCISQDYWTLKSNTHLRKNEDALRYRMPYFNEQFFYCYHNTIYQTTRQRDGKTKVEPVNTNHVIVEDSNFKTLFKLNMPNDVSLGSPVSSHDGKRIVFLDTKAKCLYVWDIP